MQRIQAYASLGVLLLAMFGCDNEPAKDKVKAGVAAPVDTAGAAAPAQNAGRFEFSEAESKLEFVGAKLTGKHDGSLGKFSGAIVGAEPEKSSVTVEIDMASLVADDPKLTGHLKSPDFFDVEKYPKARFTSTSVRAGGEKAATHTVTGNLEMHGVTKSITFPATVRMAGEAASVDAEFAINRKDFEITYPGKPDDLIKDEVLIKLTIRAKKKTV
jgi:polyisoprenoid-binding protein YceI